MLLPSYWITFLDQSRIQKFQVSIVTTLGSRTFCDQLNTEEKQVHLDTDISLKDFSSESINMTLSDTNGCERNIETKRSSFCLKFLFSTLTLQEGCIMVQLNS